MSVGTVYESFTYDGAIFEGLIGRGVAIGPRRGIIEGFAAQAVLPPRPDPGLAPRASAPRRSTVKLGFNAIGFGPKVKIDLDFVKHAESLGFDVAWTAEAYGNDAATTAAWVLANTTKLKAGSAIMQMPARTPAMTAMTAMTLDQLSEGRFILGLGPSGPQVVEGWHGLP